MRRSIFGPGPTGVSWFLDASTAIIGVLMTYIAVDSGNYDLAGVLVIVSFAFFVRAIRGLSA